MSIVTVPLVSGVSSFLQEPARRSVSIRTGSRIFFITDAKIVQKYGQINKAVSNDRS